MTTFKNKSLSFICQSKKQICIFTHIVKGDRIFPLNIHHSSFVRKYNIYFSGFKGSMITEPSCSDCPKMLSASLHSLCLPKQTKWKHFRPSEQRLILLMIVSEHVCVWFSWIQQTKLQCHLKYISEVKRCNSFKAIKTDFMWWLLHKHKMLSVKP